MKEGNNNENKNDSVDGPDIPRSEELSKEQAIAIMNSWLETLQKDDVTFDEIEKVFKVYSNNEASYKNYCSENDILRITDYYDVCTCIKNGAFDELKKRWNVYKLYINHHNKLYQMVEGTIINGKSKAFSKNELKEAKDLFMNNFSSYSSFANIRLYQPASNASQNNSGGGNSGGGKSSGGKSGGKSGGGKPDNSNPSTGTNAPTR